MEKSFANLLKKQQYGVVGRHSAVKVCEWTKKSLVTGNSCYKQKFYWIASHRCLEMTPAVGYCNQRCIFCWRHVERTIANDMEKVKEDGPEAIIEGCIEARKRLLIGFKGNEKADLDKLNEALLPKHAAISLSGEPTLYGQISDLVDAFHKRGMTTFLVTNGTQPQRLEEMSEPTQMYISLDAPDEKTYTATCRPAIEDGWTRINKSLELMPSFSCRKVIRLTLVKGLNMCDPVGYARLIKKAAPDFVEAKAFMLVGGSRDRLRLENMPQHAEVRAFAEELNKELGYRIADEKTDSRVVLLARPELKPADYVIK